MDERTVTLASQVMQYSVALKPREHVLIEAWDGAEDFVVAFVQAAQSLGAYPHVQLMNMRVNRSFILSASRESMKTWYEYETSRMQHMHAYVAIRKQENALEYADIPPAQMALYHEFHGKLHNEHRMRKLKWCVLRYPNAAMAQSASMSTEAFEDYYYAVNCIDYEKLNNIACALNKLCARTDRVRLVSPGTDLSFSIKDMCQEKSYCGIFNRPCGETGMNVVQGSANGTITYNIPSSYQGNVFTDVSLTLKDGIVVAATANNTSLINKILDTDEGARRIGEFAIGFNPLITKPIMDTLFDEKMQMSLHFTPGNGRENVSAIHWDLVQSHAKEMGGGEIWFDDILIRKDGVFVVDELLCMNPETLLPHIVT